MNPQTNGVGVSFIMSVYLYTEVTLLLRYY